MFNNIKRVAAVIALTGWMGVANASLIFDFSYGTTGNELVGVITGLDDFKDGQRQSAESISIITATGVYRDLLGINFDIADSNTSAIYNKFVVRNKEIVDSRFGLERRDRVADFRLFLTERFVLDSDHSLEYSWYSLGNLNSGYYSAPSYLFRGFVNRVDPTPAPEPSAVFLLALGLAGVSFSRYKKKS